VPGPGEALVQVHAVGVNFIEVYHRAGLYKAALPYTASRPVDVWSRSDRASAK
jgi:NADPH:quinone reductase-like Zn-dependent oxidoreductase